MTLHENTPERASADAAVDILIVEDNPNDEELAIYAFARNNLGNAIHVVRDGAEALDFMFHRGAYAGRAQARRPRIVLLDLKLPLVDGIEVLRQLKANPATRSVPVVALTSSRESADLTECYRLGINGYIVKPVDFKQFIDVVGQLGLYWLLVNQPLEE